MTRTIAYQGEAGSYSEEAVWRHFGGQGVQALACASFEAAAGAVAAGDADQALLPVENTVSGPIQEAVDAAEAAGLQEQGRFWLAIEHCIIGLPEAALGDIRSIASHPAALAQCKGILETLGVEAVEAGDTAGAVRDLAATGDPSRGAVASARAAAKHGMKVLARAVQDRGDNRTRFALYGRPLR